MWKLKKKRSWRRRLINLITKRRQGVKKNLTRNWFESTVAANGATSERRKPSRWGWLFKRDTEKLCDIMCRKLVLFELERVGWVELNVRLHFKSELFLLNGKASGKIVALQGNPISLPFFVIISNVLSQLLDQGINICLLEGFHIGNERMHPYFFSFFFFFFGGGAGVGGEGCVQLCQQFLNCWRSWKCSGNAEPCWVVSPRVYLLLLANDLLAFWRLLIFVVTVGKNFEEAFKLEELDYIGAIWPCPFYDIQAF